jgi:hypothetical protein
MQSAGILRHSMSRKAEKQIGPAGNDDRRPERKEWQVDRSDLRHAQRPNNQSLGLRDSRRSEAPKGVLEGTESFLATRVLKARLVTPSLTRRTAVCGPACTVVWEGRTSDRPPYPNHLSRPAHSPCARSHPEARNPDGELSLRPRRVPDRCNSIGLNWQATRRSSRASIRYRNLAPWAANTSRSCTG